MARMRVLIETDEDAPVFRDAPEGSEFSADYVYELHLTEKLKRLGLKPVVVEIEGWDDPTIIGHLMNERWP